MQHLITAAGLSDAIQCDSAGTSGFHVGEPPDRRMQQAAIAQGIQLSGRARQFQLEDFETFDLILAMDRENHRNIVRQDLAGIYAHKVKMMCSYCSDHSDEEVPDPYYGGATGFSYVVDLLKDACEGLLAEVS